VRKVSAAMWATFRAAIGMSMYFNSRSDVQRRVLTRWIGKAAKKVLDGGDQVASYEMAKKKLQIMDQAIALHRKWRARKDFEKVPCSFDVALGSVVGC
jgi:hypothetical protein